MSSKSSRKPKPKPKVPRALDEIQKEYQSLIFEAGQLQYQIEVFQDELEALNDALFQVNREAAERKELDTPKEEAK